MPLLILLAVLFFCGAAPASPLPDFVINDLAQDEIGPVVIPPIYVVPADDELGGYIAVVSVRGQAFAVRNPNPVAARDLLEVSIIVYFGHRGQDVIWSREFYDDLPAN